MFLPIHTDLDEDAAVVPTPTANIAIMVVTAVVSLVLMQQAALVQSLALTRGGEGHLGQLLSHSLLHADKLHLIGNLICLWAFGNALNMRIGHTRYVGLYVLTAGIAGLGWLVLGDGALAIGASGAAMGIVGAALVILPFARTQVVTWLLLFLLVLCAMVFPFFYGPLLILVGWWGYHLKTWDGDPAAHLIGRLFGFRIFPIPLLLIALVMIGLDALAVGSQDGVGHWAHLSGVAGGALIGAFANLIGAVRGSPDEPTLLEWLGALEPEAPPPAPATQWIRRAQPQPARPSTSGYWLRQDPAPQSFEEWRRQQPARRARSRERDGSGRFRLA